MLLYKIFYIFIKRDWNWKLSQHHHYHHQQQQQLWQFHCLGYKADKNGKSGWKKYFPHVCYISGRGEARIFSPLRGSNFAFRERRVTMFWRVSLWASTRTLPLAHVWFRAYKLKCFFKKKVLHVFVYPALGGGQVESSSQFLCANVTKMERRVETIIECDGGPVLVCSAILWTLKTGQSSPCTSSSSRRSLLTLKNLTWHQMTIGIAKCRQITLFCNMAFNDMGLLIFL